MNTPERELKRLVEEYRAAVVGKDPAALEVAARRLSSHVSAWHELIQIRLPKAVK